MRILIVENDPDLQEMIAEGLRLDGYAGGQSPAESGHLFPQGVSVFL